MSEPRERERQDAHEKTEDRPEDARPLPPERPREIGGRQGPDPTRYGDWEKNGRCIDF